MSAVTVRETWKRIKESAPDRTLERLYRKKGSYQRPYCRKFILSAPPYERKSKPMPSIERDNMALKSTHGRYAAYMKKLVHGEGMKILVVKCYTHDVQQQDINGSLSPSAKDDLPEL